MKRLLFKVIVLSIPFAIVFGYGFSLIKHDSLHLPAGKKNVVLLGNSRIECALNDTLMSNSVNLGRSADTYFHSYIKLREILKSNKIESVILGYDYTSFLPGIDHSFFYEGAAFTDKMNTYIRLHENRDFVSIVRFNYASLDNLLSFLLQHIVIRFKERAKSAGFSDTQLSRYGSFKYLQDRHLKLVQQKLDSVRALGAITEIDSLQQSNFQLHFLREISDLCNENGVRLLLVNVPYHKNYCASVNIDREVSRNFLLRIHEENLKQAIYLDYADFPLNDHQYSDFQHLNHEGAAVFSKVLKDTIQSGL